MNDTDRLKTALADRYTIEREVGSGGMATVYLAEDLKHHRKVAVKVLRPDLAATLGPERFLREIEVAAQLMHPHILPLYDSGEADGFLFYVMPFVAGESLRERLAREGELPIGEAVRILRDVVDALASAHRHRVVHRDIKPDNVLLTEGHAVVTDFGVAKAVSEATGRQALTTAGVALGTPTYMAPEQAVADPHTDHRADIYALGVMAYELLTGRAPFLGPTPQAILAAHVADEPEQVTKYREAVPADLAALVMRCLEKKPADRWQSTDEMLPQLEALATPSGGITPAQTQPARAVARRRPWVPAVAVGLGVVAFGVWSLARGGGAGDSGEVNPTVAVFPFASRSSDTADAFVAEALSEQIGSRLSRLPEIQVLSATAVAAQWRRTPDPLEAARALGVGRLVTGTIRRSAANLQALVEVVQASSGVQTWSSTFRRSDDDLLALEQELAESVAVALVGVSPSAETVAPGETVSSNREAYRLYLLANALVSRRTPESVQEAVDNYAEAVRLDPTFAAAWARLGSGRLIQFSWSSWTADVPQDSLPGRARVAIDRALALDSLSAEAWLAASMLAAWTEGDYPVARASFERAIRLDSMKAGTYHSYGVVLGAAILNENVRAERMLRRALALDPGLQNTWRHVALALRNRGQLAAAEAVQDTMLALGPWAPGLADRAYVRFLRGNGDGALADLDAAGRITGRQYDFERAMYRLALGDSVAARTEVEQLRAMAAEVPDSSRARHARLARMGAALGQPEVALEALEQLPRDVRTWSMIHEPLFAPLRDHLRFQRVREESRPEGAER